ncbi:MAG: AgmX/PglI C-terminal domain-containing protein [Bdellovibrionales bacterium]|jgi:hypothetical protein|nr:AgmX/PglI C-terminal domain-containing protein [Bdellovibrionales bacterium]
MNEAKRLALENNDGVVVRTLAWPEGESDTLTIVRRKDTRRLELLASLEALKVKRLEYETLGTISRADVEKGSVEIAGVGRLTPMKENAAILLNEKYGTQKEFWRGSLATVFVLFIAFVSVMKTRPLENPKAEEEIQQQVVQIIKRIQVKPQPKPAQVNIADTRVSAQTTRPANKSASIKRMGALAVFGSAKSGSQKGGVNLGAVNTTAGPGLGGTEGSGGVQTSIYGKGLVAAPLGAGGNMQGGGGYGTKGKGGGQAGYGQISLVGSAGTAPIPLGREAIIGGGLDRDLIADVINRNLGQVRFCYEQGLQGDPALAGRVAVDFTIGSNGQVKVASVGSTTLNSKLVEDCILLRLRTWKFPLPEGGMDVKVSYPFALRRTGQG